MRKIIIWLGNFSKIIELFIIPLTIVACLWFRYIKFLGIHKFPFSKRIFYKIGVFPIVDHYYEPQFNFDKEKEKLTLIRQLQSIKFNIESQIKLINSFSYFNELQEIVLRKPASNKYFFNNGSFNSGDSEFYYSIIRSLKPNKIIEVGSGFSTLIALEAIAKNLDEKNHRTEIICVEPYEMPWLESLNVSLKREKVENTDLSLYSSLEQNDILFIDSSHIIRPNGDVCFELLHILPLLNEGVYVHFHDIFTPYHYPYEWLNTENRFWNEQYLLEAYLIQNESVEVISMLHYLFRHHYKTLAEKFPGVKEYPDKAPGSFWLRVKSQS